MNKSTTCKSLLYQHAIVLSILEIREQYLKIIFKEVYENIGQILTLVRVRLSMPQTQDDFYQDDTKARHNSFGELVGQAIKDLRNLCKYFYPDLAITEVICLRLFRTSSKLLDLNPLIALQVKGKPKRLTTGKTIILFQVLYEILNSIKEVDKGELKKLKITYINAMVRFNIAYTGNATSGNRMYAHSAENTAFQKLNIFERIELTGGELSMKTRKNNVTSIKINIPFNQLNHE